ncbi:MAG: murein biosynthesis integral membrane protein MurJ [Desulfohalobiaceae bacterium]
MQEQDSKIARGAAVISGATFVSRVLGFVRDLVLAFALGAGPMADAFFVAFRIPNLLRRLFAEGSLTMAFVPVFTETRQKQGEAEAFALARSTLVWLLLILGGLSLLALAGAVPLTMLIAPGFVQDQEIFQLTTDLVRICFPYILFISGMALCMGVLNSLQHFLAPALAPALLNVVLILAALLGLALGWTLPYVLAWGVLVAGLAQFLFQQPFLSRQGFVWRGPWSWRHPGVGRIGQLMLPTVLGAAVYQINILVNTMLASLLAQGSISYLYYADRLVQFPLGVFGVALSTAALPSLSGLASAGRDQEFTQTLNMTLGLNLFISLPAAAGLIGLGVPLVDTLFGRGAFGQLAVSSTAWALAGYSLGLPAFSCVRSLVSAFYALQDTKTPVLVASLCLFLNIGLALILMQYLAHTGLALAVALSSWANILLLGYFLGRKKGAWFAWQGKIWSMAGLSLVLGLGCFLSSNWGWLSLLLIPLWAGAYFLLALALGVPEAGILKRNLLKTKPS